MLSPRLSKPILALLACLLTLSLFACGISNRSVDQALEQTRVALDVQATTLALARAQPQQAPTANPLQATNEALQAQVQALATQAAAAALRPSSAPPTADLSQATQLAGQVATLSSQATARAVQSTQQALQPPPPQTAPTVQPQAPAPPAQAPAGRGAVDASLEVRIKAAKILLYEDISGSGKNRLVKLALDQGGYSYVDVGSALGWFKKNLTSGENWDLIIAASEQTGALSGEYFDMLHDYAVKGTAVAMEMWQLNVNHEGKIRTLLDDCGIAYHSDWDNPASRAIYWLAPDNPIFHTPNEIGNGMRTTGFWYGDVGDIVTLATRGGKPTHEDAVILAGANLQDRSTGMIATCMGGRVVMQFVGSHEYVDEDITKLWQNYVYNTLYNHFLVH